MNTPATVSRAEVPRSSHSVEYDVTVVGAGFAGISALCLLRERGLSVRVLEAGDGVGGTWYWNRYPGARVDGPSMQYSLSFSPELDQDWHWPEDYSAQPELERYANYVVDRFDLRQHIQLQTRVVAATFQESASRWLVETDGGDQILSRYLVTAVGCLSAANVPPIPGLERFEGRWYHTSRWPRQGVAFSGKRVGVVGTGSTGIQTIPVLAAEAEHLTVFQRTPSYSVPSHNKPMDPGFEREWKLRYREHRQNGRNSRGGYVVSNPPERSALEVSEEQRTAAYERAWSTPGEGAFGILNAFNDILTSTESNETAAEFVRKKIQELVEDPFVAEMLTPRNYPIGAKRLCVDSGYFETYNRDNVTLVDVKAHPIVEVTSTGLRTTGEQYPLEVLVFATGFDAMTGPLLRLGIVGRDGVSLRDKWRAGPQTYLGLSAAEFPNMFIVSGPCSPSVLTNMTTSIAQHTEWIADAISYLLANGLEYIEAEADAEAQWGQEVSRAAAATVMDRADSWYKGANIAGKPRVFMPYAAGLDGYTKICDDVAAQNYKGFITR
jgi:cyclohexanone monooxygenase